MLPRRVPLSRDRTGKGSHGGSLLTHKSTPLSHPGRLCWFRGWGEVVGVSGRAKGRSVWEGDLALQLAARGGAAPSAHAARGPSSPGLGRGKAGVEGARGRGRPLEPSRPHLPTRCFLFRWIPLPCRNTKLQARALMQIPSPATRLNLVVGALAGCTQQWAAGGATRALGTPRSTPGPPASRWWAAQKRLGAPTCRVRARAARPEFSSRFLLSGKTAPSL